MPTRKQRRRRQKDLRHEWEEVYLDEEGRELAPEEVEELVPERAQANGRGAHRERGTQKGGGQAKRQARTRAVREMQPPSWRKVFKRTAIFAPLMFLFISFTSKDSGPLEDAIVTVWLMLVFIPFSYLMDRLTYRIWQKRAERPAGGKRR